MRLTTTHPQSSYGVPIFVNGQSPVDYAEGIKWLRQKHDLSTSQLGERLGVSGRTVDSWEQGLRMPAKSVLLLIKVVFGI